jgi:acetyltransferase-like isoleucine patch superfamily enzyme
MNARRKFALWEYLAFDSFMWSLEAILYFVALAGPVMLLWSLRGHHPLVLLAVAVLSYFVVALTFVLCIVALRWILCGRIPEGRFLRTSRRVLPWSGAQVLRMILERSPFFPLVTSHIVFRQIYYRGMGTGLDWTVYTATGAVLADPWAIRIGSHSVIGQEAIITAHKIERDVVTLEPVELGAGVLIGARAHVQCGVKIGDGAVVGTEALVTRGTVIPPGEVWAGNPARKVDPLAMLGDRS